jgi:hypothetical protein
VAKSNTPVVNPDWKLKKLYQVYWEPTFSCKNQVRVGRAGDGGKWVCNPQELLLAAQIEERKVLIYSLGSNGDVSQAPLIIM